MLRLAVVVVLGTIMSILDTTIVNVALETLSRDLHSSIGSIQWVATAYLLALAAVIPVTGWASRRVGTRRLYMLSLVCFTAGSALCGLAWSVGSLVVFRVLQGVGGGMLLPVGQMILARAAGPQRMGRVMSVLGVPMVLAPVFGPALGGLILEHLGWRWIFFVNVPIGILAFVLASRRLPVAESTGRPGPIDAVGFGLLGIGLPTLVYGLAELGGRGGVDVEHVLVPLLAGVALVAGFVVHALRAGRPLLDVRLFANSAFSAAVLTTFVLGAVLFGAMLLLPLYFQQVRGESAAVTGLLIAPQGIGAAVAMPLAGRLTDRVGGGLVALVGVLVTVVGTLPFAFIGAHTSFVLIGAALVLRGLGIGIAIMPSISAAYAVLRPDQVPDATPQLNVSQRVGGSIGTAVFAVVLANQLRSALPTAAGAADAYGNVYWWVTGATAVALLPAALLSVVERRRRRAARERPRPEPLASAEPVG